VASTRAMKHSRIVLSYFGPLTFSLGKSFLALQKFSKLELKKILASLAPKGNYHFEVE
jgi:hypothetical protein